MNEFYSKLCPNDTRVSKKLRLLTFGSVNYASTAGGYAAVTKGLMQIHPHEWNKTKIKLN